MAAPNDQTGIIDICPAKVFECRPRLVHGQNGVQPGATNSVFSVFWSVGLFPCESAHFQKAN
jgi:hypothetical protein